MFVYRDEKYHPETEHKGIAEIIIGKARNGPTGTLYRPSPDDEVDVLICPTCNSYDIEELLEVPDAQ
ncbi:hypothetical protein L1887_59141 [Cichorium endivia]|nr:hypothetical protein L1887_59141 [Cichorium endivia]